MNIPYHFSRFIGYLRRKSFCANILSLKQPYRLFDVESPTIPYHFYFLCCNRDWPEQVASLLSLYLNVGIPRYITIVSDGTISSTICDLLESISPIIKVVDYKTLVSSDIDQSLLRFSSLHPMGIKLLVEVIISKQASFHLPVVYSDTDVLFFSNVLLEHLSDGLEPNGPFKGLYLMDCLPSIDKNLETDNISDWQPLNAGFLAWSHEPDWSFALSKLGSYLESSISLHETIFNHHSEQSLVQLTMRHTSSSPLPHYACIVSIADQFIFKDIALGSDMVSLRHYIGNVRHKLWHSLPLVLGSKYRYLFNPIGLIKAHVNGILGAFISRKPKLLD